MERTRAQLRYRDTDYRKTDYRDFFSGGIQGGTRGNWACYMLIRGTRDVYEMRLFAILFAWHTR